MSKLIEPKGFLFENKNGVGLITLNRPNRLNALTFSIYEELRDFFAELQFDNEVRCVVITGSGRAFCSGGDKEDIIGELFARDMKGLLEFTRCTGALIRNIHTLKKPVIAAINGVAVGAGAVISIACDLRVASEDARLGFIFPQVGLSGADMGASYLLPRLIGMSRASELLFTGRLINAEEAQNIGLFHRVTSKSNCLLESLSWAKELANGPSFAHRMTKQMLISEQNMSLDEAIEAEAQAQAICMQHSDFKEAYDAWSEKRAPSFEL